MIVLSLAICALCGLSAALPFRDLDSSLPAWYSLAPVFWIVAREVSKKRAALHAFVFALVWSARSFTFLWNCAFEGAIALSIYTAAIYTVALLGIRPFARRSGGAAIFGVASVWVLAEILRSVVPILRFPWLLLGHSLLHNAPLRQGADLLGVYGLSFIIAAFNALLAFGLPSVLPEHFRVVPGAGVKSAWRNGSLLLALIGGFYFYGYERIERLEPLLKPGATIALVQGNIKTKLGRTSDDLKAQLLQHLDLHRKIVAQVSASESAPPALVCWAETMVPGEMNRDEMGERFRSEITKVGVPTLAGSNFVEAENAADPGAPIIHNCAYIFDGQGRELTHYFKRNLVAFGEYVPGARDYPILRGLRSVTRDVYLPGTEPSVITEVAGYRIALNLCVEDIHPWIAREAAFDGADTLINLTNDGWFYGTFGPRAHLQAAAWRAIETRRPVLRVTNTGFTVSIDPLGEIKLALPLETEAVGSVKLLRIDNGGEAIVTPYMRLGEFWTAAIFIFVLWASLWLKPDGK